MISFQISVLSQGLEMTTLDFIALYSPLAQPVQCIFYFLAVICTISILDRLKVEETKFEPSLNDSLSLPDTT